MRKRLSSGQKWFLRPYFPLIRGMFVFRSGLRFSFRALEVPEPRVRKRSLSLTKMTTTKKYDTLTLWWFRDRQWCESPLIDWRWRRLHCYIVILFSPPYICYVTLPGGSCFATFENCNTKVEDQNRMMNVRFAVLQGQRTFYKYNDIESHRLKQGAVLPK